MKRAFIRAFWGDVYWVNNYGKQASKIRKDVENTIANSYTEPFHIYVMGEKDADALSKNRALMDIATIKLVSTASIWWDMETQMWRHKLDILEAAMRDFDEIVFLDWDVRATRPLPSDFWEVMSLKSTFQANLFQYRTKKCLWRQDEQRKTCNGGFVYIGHKSIPSKIIRAYDDLEMWVWDQKKKRESQGKTLRFREEALIRDDEPSMSKYVDGLYGEWPGSDVYLQQHEPVFCNLRRKSAYDQEVLDLKDICFYHHL